MVSKSERIARRRPAPRGHASSLSCLDTYPLRLTLLPLPGPPFLPPSLPPSLPADCVKFPFSKTIHDKTHARHCDLCYCYVCDKPASECDEWGTEATAGHMHQKHCHAFAPAMASKMVPVHLGYSHGQLWSSRRQAAKVGGQDKEKKERRAARLKKLQTAMDKVKVHFDCGCHVCNALRTFIADKKATELVAVFGQGQYEDRECFEDSLKKESSAKGASVAFAIIPNIDKYSYYATTQIMVWKPGSTPNDAKGARLSFSVLNSPFIREHNYRGDVYPEARNQNNAVNEDEDDTDKTVIIGTTSCKGEPLPQYPAPVSTTSYYDIRKHVS